MRSELEEALKTVKNTNGKAKRDAERNVWVLRGALDHDLNLSLLVKIIEKYKLIDTVPLGYFQAELYLKKENRQA